MTPGGVDRDQAFVTASVPPRAGSDARRATIVPANRVLRFMFDRLAEIAAEYLRKGSHIYVEGRIRTRKWQDKEGHDRYTTEIVANEMNMLGGRGGGDRSSGAPAPERTRERNEEPAARAETAGVAESFDDDIPF